VHKLLMFARVGVLVGVGVGVDVSVGVFVSVGVDVSVGEGVGVMKVWGWVCRCGNVIGCVHACMLVRVGARVCLPFATHTQGKECLIA
jgi:hypothetical protein